jgi:hypothetical protein
LKVRIYSLCVFYIVIELTYKPYILGVGYL